LIQKKLVILLFCLFGLSCNRIEFNPFINLPKEINIVFIAGQSNASSAGAISSDNDDLINSIQLSKGFIFSYKCPCINVYDPYMKCNTYKPRFGVELGILSSLQEENYLFIKYSKGATGIELREDEIDFHSESEDESYQEMVQVFKNGINEAQDLFEKVNYKGFIWIHGESDAKNQEAATSYSDNLYLMYDEIMNELNLDRNSLPFILTELSNLNSSPFKNEIQNQQKFFVDTISNGVLHETSNLTLIDNVHYDGTSIIRLGQELKNYLN
jgi:hypothetical protein